MECVAKFEEFYDLLTKTHDQHKKKPAELEKELRKVIKKGKQVLQELKRQDRQKTEGQELREHSQECSDIDRNKGKESDSPVTDKSERTSLTKVDERVLASKDTKVVEKKSVECQVEAADQSSIRNLKEELIGSKRHLEEKEREIESLMRRVAHYSDMLTKQDQREIEETTSSNRQSKVEHDFKLFTSEERIDTCIRIQGKEKTCIDAKRLTSMMFEVVYEYVLSIKAAMTDALKEISKFAVENGPCIGSCYLKQKVQRSNRPNIIEVPLSLRGSDCPRQVLYGLLLAIKESAPEINTEVFLEDVKHEILRPARELPRERSCKLNPSEKLLHDLDAYLRACIKLTWRMVTQAPPMRLEYHTFTYNTECHKVVESQDEAEGDRYQGARVYYLWPGLKDGGGRTIFKGEVALEK